MRWASWLSSRRPTSARPASSTGLATVVSAVCRPCSRASSDVLFWNSVLLAEVMPRVELFTPAVLVDWTVIELVLLSLLTTAGFVQGFVYRRRRYLVLFAVGLEAMLYTQATAGLYAFGAVCALGVVYWFGSLTPGSQPVRAGFVRDAAICLGAVASAGRR